MTSTATASVEAKLKWVFLNQIENIRKHLIDLIVSHAHPSAIDATAENGIRLLHVSAATNNLDICKILLGGGSSLYLVDHDGNTPLISAILGELAYSKLKSKTDSKFVTFEEARRLDVIAYLIRAGAPVDTANKLGRTPLFLAAAQNLVPIVKLLLDAGADYEKMDSTQKTPLMIATCLGHTEVVDLIMGHLKFPLSSYVKVVSDRSPGIGFVFDYSSDSGRSYYSVRLETGEMKGSTVDYEFNELIDYEKYVCEKHGLSSTLYLKYESIVSNINRLTLTELNERLETDISSKNMEVIRVITYRRRDIFVHKNSPVLTLDELLIAIPQLVSELDVEFRHLIVDENNYEKAYLCKQTIDSVGAVLFSIMKENCKATHSKEALIREEATATATEMVDGWSGAQDY